MTGVEAKAVLEHAPYKGAQRFALYRIAEIVNERNDWMYWQRNAELAEEIGVSRQTVSGWMQDFINDGWIEPLSETDGRFGNATRYRFARRFSVSEIPTPSVGIPDTVCPDTRHLVSANPTRKERELKERDTRERKHIDRGFDAWWDQYPKKVGKKAASKAYDKAIQTVSAITLLNAVIAYRDHDQRVADGYVMNPATWLNGECWNDEIQTRRSKKGVYEQTGDLVAEVFAQRQPRTQHKEIDR